MTTSPPPRPDLRRIPATTSVCQLCKRPIVWAVTMAGPNGPGGKSQPFDPVEDLAGRVALYPRSKGRLFARALAADEQVDRPLEYAGMPHAATCTRSPLTIPAPGRRDPLPPGVVDLAEERARRYARGPSR